MRTMKAIAARMEEILQERGMDPESEIDARSKLKKLSKEMEKYRHEKEQAESKLRELDALSKRIQTWLDTYYEAKGQRPKKPALKGH